jgi:enterochelin esterase-like enzyme
LDGVADWSLISGPLPWIVTTLGVFGGLWLLSGRKHWFAHRAVPLCTTFAVLATVVLYVVVEKWWRPFPDPIAMTIYVWIGVAICGVALTIPRIIAARGRLAKVASVFAVVVLALAAGAQINLQFAEFPTIRAALGLPDKGRTSFAELATHVSKTVEGVPLDRVWHAPADMPTDGKVATVPIPGERSGFDARPAEIYAPPAYFSDPRPLLPVLVLLAGQPGAPEDWLRGGRLVETMNRFASVHAGLAPVVVVADATGSELANPLCTDSNLGNVATYLAVDVPAWIKAHLQIDQQPRAWAVAGLSYGGTCALQMATNNPDIYPTFIDLSGQEEPTLGDRQRTVAAAFGGNEAAFIKVNPVDLMKTRKYPTSAGAFVVGSDDEEYRPGQIRVAQAAREAGMDVTYSELPGGHSWSVWSAGLEKQMNWLAKRLGLIG